MKSMPNINLTQEEYDNMTTYHRFSRGGEGIICRSPREDTLYKIFVKYDTVTPVGLSDNKYQKIKILYEKKLDDSVQPLSTISLNSELIGYEMTYDKNDISLDAIRLFRRQLVQSLQETTSILQYFAREDVIYGDVKENNILINRKTKKSKFCDMDNALIGEYKIDLLSDYVDSFITSPEDIDESVDAYMHNLMTLRLLNAPDLNYDEILYNLSEGKYRNAYKKEARPALNTMASPERFTGEYIAPYVKRIK